MTGITLTVTQIATAQRIIHRAMTKEIALDLDTPERAAKMLKIILERDASLESMLSLPGDKKRFRENAARLRPPAAAGKPAPTIAGRSGTGCKCIAT